MQFGDGEANFKKSKIHLETNIDQNVDPNREMIPRMFVWAGDAVLKFKEKLHGRFAHKEITVH